MKLRWKLLVLVLVTGWYLQEPIPKNFSHPWKLRALLASFKITTDVAFVLEQCGIVSSVDALNALLIATMATEYPGFDMDTIRDEEIEGVNVRVYQPQGTRHKDDSDGMPCLIYYHGGGWALSNPKAYDSMMIPIAKRTDMLIVSVDYRKAPGYIYPAALDDCLAVTKYLINNADQFGVDPQRIAIGGDSAGGNLAAAVSLKLREEVFRPMPKLQLLVYPVLQFLDYSLPSKVQNSEGPLVRNFYLAYYTELYAFGKSKYASAIAKNQHTSPEVKKRLYNTHLHHENLEMNYHYAPYQKPKLDFGDSVIWAELKDVFMSPYVSPLLADDLSDLPEAYVYTPQYCSLRDEGILYAQRLQQAGVPTKLVLGKNTFHGVCNYMHLFPEEAHDCIGSIVDFLQKL